MTTPRLLIRSGTQRARDAADAFRAPPTERMAVLQSASPAWVGRIAPLDVVVVVAVLDHLALVVEAQHRRSRVAEFLALLGPVGPPFDRSPVAGDDGLAKPALDILLGQELLAEVAADASQAQVRRAERRPAVQRRVGA